MTIEEQLKPLFTEFEKLKQLADDPQPGLFTWQECVHENLLNIRTEATILLLAEQERKPC